MFNDLPTLETDRLILRKVHMMDAADMYAYGSNEEVSEFVTWDTHQSLADTKEFIHFIVNNYENKQVAPWGIECKKNRKFIGTIDFVSWDPRHKVAEIGYVLSKEYWGEGYMTEAAKEVVKFGFENMDLERIQARCLVENTGSARVMEKIGMTFEGISRKVTFTKGKHQDLKIYSILRHD